MTDLSDAQSRITSTLDRLAARIALAASSIDAVAPHVTAGGNVMSVAVGALETARDDVREVSDAVDDMVAAAREMAWPSPTVDLPSAAALVESLDGAVTPKTAYNWLSGDTCPPAWAVARAAAAMGMDAGALTLAFASKWESCRG